MAPLNHPLTEGKTIFFMQCWNATMSLAAPCTLSDSGSLPPKLQPMDPKQIQARRVVVAEPQIECFSHAADDAPKNRGENHFLCGHQQRDNDPRAPCTLSDSGSLAPKPLGMGPKQIQARRVVVAEPQTDFLCCGAE